MNIKITGLFKQLIPYLSNLAGFKHFVLVIIWFFACEKPDRNNPWDEEANPELWAPHDMEYEVSPPNSVTISWKWDYNVPEPEGFKVERKKADDDWQFEIIGPESKTYTDTIVDFKQFDYHYRIYAFAGANESKKAELVVAYLGFEEVFNPITGKTWMDRNLGAARAATTSTDAEAYGDLYQWGRGTDGHEKRNSATTSILSSNNTPGHGDFILVPSTPRDWRSPQNDNLWQGVNGENNPCPKGYRLPTEAEWNAERLSWTSNNSSGAFSSPLKLSVGGDRDNGNGSLRTPGSGGGYWSSTISGSDARSLNFAGSYAHLYSNHRAVGRSVRCIKD